MKNLTVLLLCFLVSPGRAYQNVYGGELQPCSSDGMALTGYTRNSLCVDRNDDAGSHHICIDMQSTQGGGFCSVTGQTDWCDSEMPCDGDTDNYCQVQNWCVCQWAFASYIQKAGGCDMIQDIVCESINMEALVAYKKSISKSKYKTALKCIVDRCGVDKSSILVGTSGAQSTWIGLSIGSVVLLGAIFWHLKLREKNEKLSSALLETPDDAISNGSKVV